MLINKQKRKMILLCVGALSVILAVWTAWGNTALMVSEIAISSDRLPASFSSFRIAHVSDLHNTEFGEGNTTLLEKLSELQPDIIMITGDLIDARHTNVEVACDFAERANKIAPTYYVSGNHEAGSNQYVELKDGLVLAGITVLDDDTITLERNGESITILGLADPNFTIMGDLFNEVPAMVSAKIDNMLEKESIQ